MALVTVKNKYRVVIPQALREKLAITRGDVLEAKVEGGRITYTPKTVIDRIPAGKIERERFFKQLCEQAPNWLKETWTASSRRGTDKLTTRQINAEISAVRRRRAKKD
jgi:AbrB family looped-hinge helix DNA binding protein